MVLSRNWASTCWALPRRTWRGNPDGCAGRISACRPTAPSRPGRSRRPGYGRPASGSRSPARGVVGAPGRRSPASPSSMACPVRPPWHSSAHTTIRARSRHRGSAGSLPASALIRARRKNQAFLIDAATKPDHPDLGFCVAAMEIPVAVKRASMRAANSCGTGSKDGASGVSPLLLANLTDRPLVPPSAGLRRR